jgi:hypothetical protein
MLPRKYSEFVVSFPEDTQPFVDALLSVLDMHLKKGKDYGDNTNPYANIEASEKWGIPAWVGIALRMGDKEQRIQSFLLKGGLANESVRDSIHDNAVYGILRLMEYDRVNPQSDPGTNTLAVCEAHGFDARGVCVKCGWSVPSDHPSNFGHTFEGLTDECSRCGIPGTEWEYRTQQKRPISCDGWLQLRESVEAGVGERAPTLRYNSMGDAPSD